MCEELFVVFMFIYLNVQVTDAFSPGTLIIQVVGLSLSGSDKLKGSLHIPTWLTTLCQPQWRRFKVVSQAGHTLQMTPKLLEIFCFL